MAATTGLSLTWDPMGKMFKNASSLKALGPLKPNFLGMIIGRFSTKFLFFMPIGHFLYSTKSYAIAFDLLFLWTLLPSNFKDENIF